MKYKNRAEIAVTVDVINRNGNCFIEADVCGEDGLILAEGPSAEIMEITEKELSSWLEEYESFLKCS